MSVSGLRSLQSLSESNHLPIASVVVYRARSQRTGLPLPNPSMDEGRLELVEKELTTELQFRHRPTNIFKLILQRPHSAVIRQKTASASQE